MNDDANQVHVPESFMALFTRPGSYRLTESRSVVQERYELCEDMAQMLTEQASNHLHGLGITEQDVLGKMLLALRAEGSPVSPAEATWVVRRLAELLGWEQPRIEEDPGA